MRSQSNGLFVIILFILLSHGFISNVDSCNCIPVKKPNVYSTTSSTSTSSSTTSTSTSNGVSVSVNRAG